MRVVFVSSPEEEKFYTVIAVAEALNDLVDRENFADVRFFYFSSKPFDRKMVYENNLRFQRMNVALLKTPLLNFLSFLESLLQLFVIFPDVVFSAGGLETKPFVRAAKWLGIPVIVHEENSFPDEVNEEVQDIAFRITVAYREVALAFKKENREKIVHTGQPLRKVLRRKIDHGAQELLNLEADVPVIWVRGGKEGSLFMNQIIEESLPELLSSFQVVHQTGKDSFNEIKMLTDASLEGNSFRYRYHLYDELDDLSKKMLASVASVAVTRARVELFELAYWEIPAIVIPRTNTYRNFEIENAYNYARAGAGVVIEENNLTSSGLVFELRRILENFGVRQQMIEGARKFRVDDSEDKIAREIAKIYLSHEVEDKEV